MRRNMHVAPSSDKSPVEPGGLLLKTTWKQAGEPVTELNSEVQYARNRVRAICIDLQQNG